MSKQVHGGPALALEGTGWQGLHLTGQIPQCLLQAGRSLQSSPQSQSERAGESLDVWLPSRPHSTLYNACSGAWCPPWALPFLWGFLGTPKPVPSLSPVAAILQWSPSRLQAWWGNAGGWGPGSAPTSGLTAVKLLHWREPQVSSKVALGKLRGPSNLRGFFPGFRREFQSFQRPQRSRGQEGGRAEGVGQPDGSSESQPWLVPGGRG